MKRKYTKRSPRWDKPLENTPTIEIAPKAITYEDLPLSIRTKIDNISTYRQGLGLPDDSVERKQKATNYYKLHLERRS